MPVINALERFRKFLDSQIQVKERVTTYFRKEDQLKYFKGIDIGVEMEGFKEIILQEETKIELGGTNNKSFSLVYPVDTNIVNDGKIVLIGPEIKGISSKAVDFGFILLIGVHNPNENSFEEFKNLNFISNGIEGFMIRSIPRKFWCRLSKTIIDKFSFEFLGNAIMFLFSQKFEESIESMEILFINSYPGLIQSLIDETASIRTDLEQKWRKKVNEWKRRIDCEFEWDCNECPYYDICEDIKDVLEQREVLDK